MKILLKYLNTNCYINLKYYVPKFYPINSDLLLEYPRFVKRIDGDQRTLAPFENQASYVCIAKYYV